MWILVGALIGAIAGAASSIIAAKLSGRKIDWKDVGAAALTGAVTGAIASATLGTGLLVGPVARTVGGAALGAVAGALSTGLSNEFHGRPLLQGVKNAVIVGAVGGAVGGFVLGPVARSLPTPSIVRTVLSGATGNGAGQVADNLLEGKPVLDHVAQAVTTGALVASGIRAAAPLIPVPEEVAAIPRTGTSAPAPIASEPLPTGPVAASAPAVETAPPVSRAPPAVEPAPSSAAPPAASASAPEARKGVVQILAELEAPDPTTATTPTGNGVTPTGTGTTPTGNGVTPTGTSAPVAAAPAVKTPVETPVAEGSSKPVTKGPLGGDEALPPTAAERAGFDKVATTPLGTSPQVGDFTGIAGKTIPEILARIPEGAEARVLRPVAGGSQEGVEYKWTAPAKNADGTPVLNEDQTPKTVTWRVRIHDADPNAGPGSNAGDGWVVRVQRGAQYLDDAGNAYTQNELTPTLKQQNTPRGATEPVTKFIPNPNYNAGAAAGTHIPVAGNPHAPSVAY